MQTCEYQTDCPAHQAADPALAALETYCWPEIKGKKRILECEYRRLMPCGHPRLYQYASPGHEGYLGGPPLTYLLCRKCHEEAAHV